MAVHETTVRASSLSANTRSASRTSPSWEYIEIRALLTNPSRASANRTASPCAARPHVGIPAGRGVEHPACVGEAGGGHGGDEAGGEGRVGGDAEHDGAGVDGEEGAEGGGGAVAVALPPGEEGPLALVSSAGFVMVRI